MTLDLCNFVEIFKDSAYCLAGVVRPVAAMITLSIIFCDTISIFFYAITVAFYQQSTEAASMFKTVRLLRLQDVILLNFPFLSFLSDGDLVYFTQLMVRAISYVGRKAGHVSLFWQYHCSAQSCGRNISIVRLI